MGRGKRLTVSQLTEIYDYIALGMSATEISEATHVSMSVIYKYKSIYSSQVNKKVNARKGDGQTKIKPMKETPPTSVSVDYADYLRVVELCERFNVPRHIGLRCLLHPEEMKKQESQLNLGDRVVFLERRLAEERARNAVLLEQL
jgi:transposase